ncbi:MAG: GTPase ObgE [Candidatus Pacebacteria bacterium]|nr:GTPase ObgE [Candidatus Paceibacterota bacterium]
MAFTDEIILKIKAGDGGNGVVKWLRTRRDQKGGPVGGDGGRGGDVYFVGIRDVEYLAKYTSNPKFVAQNGEQGGGNSLEGKDGNTLYIKIPVGSLVTDLSTGREYDILEEGLPVSVLSGGRGGYGNEHFKSSRNVTPMEQTNGKQGEASSFKVELRLVADAGLIGFPNAGKSTLLNTLTNSKAKIGNYDFTTLNPNLGVLNDYILADIPGLIEGASSGKGLGDRFLRHIMRTNILVHCISVERGDIIAAYNTIRKELQEYNPELTTKKELIVITKIDMVSEANLRKAIKELSNIGVVASTVSILDDESIQEFTGTLMSVLSKSK